MSKWQAVQALVHKYIDDHELKTGDPIPSDGWFAEQVGCSLQPVLRAMGELEQRRVIRRRAGAASTVLSRPEMRPPYNEFSFSASCKKAGNKLENRLLELSHRLPGRGELEAYEQRAQQALGLKREQPFYTIARLRVLDGVPRAIHRVYLKPAFFPGDFLTRHEFTKESLVDVYTAAGLQLSSRDTILRARMPLASDEAILKTDGRPVLEAEQMFLGLAPDSDKLTVVEYLVAHYLDWEYSIHDRRTA